MNDWLTKTITLKAKVQEQQKQSFCKLVNESSPFAIEVNQKVESEERKKTFVSKVCFKQALLSNNKNKNGIMLCSRWQSVSIWNLFDWSIQSGFLIQQRLLSLLKARQGKAEL